MKFFCVKFIFIIVIFINLTACGVKSMPNASDRVIYPAQFLPPLEPIGVIPRVLKQNNTLAPAIKDPNSFWQYPNTPPTK